MPIDHALRRLIERACLAPSSHNTQPWRFRVDGTSRIDLFADRTRALPVNDPFDRELVISCGAALFALRAAAAAAGRATRVTLAPDPADADWLARVELHAQGADASLAELATALEQRRTYRRAFGPQPVSEATRAALCDAVAQEGAHLHGLEGEAARRAAELVAEGDRLQWDDPHWRRELALWMHPRRRGDGLTVPALALPIAQAVVRTFDIGNGVAAGDRQLAEGSPWLSVIATEGDDMVHWLRAGQALQRALLAGVRMGLQASHLNQPVQVPELRPRLQALLGADGLPQLLLRWGHPTQDVAAAPRRPVDAVIDTAMS